MHRTGLGHQYGRFFIGLGHQYGRRDVMWKHSIRHRIALKETTWEDPVQGLQRKRNAIGYKWV